MIIGVATRHHLTSGERKTTIVDAAKIRIMANIVPPGTFELRSTLHIGPFVVFTIFGPKLYHTRNISESKKKITDINRMSHTLSQNKRYYSEQHYPLLVISVELFKKRNIGKGLVIIKKRRKIVLN